MTEQPIPYHTVLTRPGSSPRRWFFMLHGFLGAGRNWGTVARRLVENTEEWGGVLVDLRLHGRSTGFAPPHTVRAAAGDLVSLADALGFEPVAVLGHSFGGKVALDYAALAATAPDQVWVFDSTPDVAEPGGAVWDTLHVICDLEGPFGSRQEAIEALRRRGIDERTSMWLATNLERSEDGVVWKPDLRALEELLLSFFTTELWPVVEEPPSPTEIHFVKAERSAILTPEACERVERAGHRTGRVFLHTVAGGHWLNVDNPDGLLDLLLTRLP
jgi:esterase